MTSKCDKNKKVAHILRSSLICYWTEHGNMESICFILKSFNKTRKPTFAHFGKHEKSHLTSSIVHKNETISLVAMRSEELGLVEENHTTVKLGSNFTSLGIKTYSESRIELRNLQILKKKSAGKVATVFVIRAALWAEKLGCCLEFCRSWKNTLGKPAAAVNTGGHSIKFEFWMKGVFVTVEIMSFVVGAS